MEDGKEYVCAGKGEIFKKIEYTKREINKAKRSASARLSIIANPTPKILPPDCVRPKIATLIRNGIKPRKVNQYSLFSMFLLNVVF